jgi:hypothetical protein
MAAQRDWWTDWNLSYLDDAYGPVYGGHSVQEAVYNTLQKWLPTYIAEFNRVLGSEVLELPFEYRHRPEFRTLPRNAKAAVLVSVPTTVGSPQIYQNAIRTNFRVEAMVYVYGTKDWQETEALTQAYTACIRTCLVQKRGLEGFAETTVWDGEEYLEGEHSSGRTTGIGHARFVVTVGSAMNMHGGLPLPSTAAPSALPEVEAVNIAVEKEPLQ